MNRQVTYALTIDNTIHNVGPLPSGALRLDGGGWITPPDRQWTPEQAAACGYLPVVDLPRPADTATDTSDRAQPVIVGDHVERGWTVRPWTPEELAAQAQRVAREADRTEATTLAGKVSQDIGPKLTGAETWPTVQTWRTLSAVKRADVTTVSGVMQIIVWMVPAMLRTARLARKAYRIASGDVRDDSAAGE